MLNSKLSVKDRLFCYYYAKLHNPKEAAIKAGFPSIFAEERACKLLQKEPIRKQIIVLLKEETAMPLQDAVRSGLERISFGSVNDSIKLLLYQEHLVPEEIDRLDLFPVSEIKKGKDGVFEIRFHDRFKALEMLSEQQMHAQEQESAQLFYAALEQGASAIRKVKTEKDENHEI